MRRWFLVVLILGLAAAGYWFAQTQSQAKPEPVAQAPQAARAVPVALTTVTPKDMPLLFRSIGTVQAAATVAVRPRVDSVIQQVHFSEGQEVKAGDPLFTLDPRTYDAALAQAQANLERDRANSIKAQADVVRYTELVRANAIAKSQLDAAVATANALEATIKADQAQIDNAKLSLSFTKIVAPMDGRTGVVSVNSGTMVRAAEATPLVTINQLRPILVSFNVPERNLPALRAAMAAGPVPVSVAVRDASAKPVEGKLSFIDAQVDQASGTIVAKAQFDNTDTRLWPGAFVDVTVTLRVDDKALTLPDVAVQTSQKGRFVFALKADDTVEVRPVTVARIQDGVAVITQGLNPGDRVVTEGQSRLVPGTKVVDRSNAGDNTPAKDGDKPRNGKGKPSDKTADAKGGPA